MAMKQLRTTKKGILPKNRTDRRLFEYSHPRKAICHNRRVAGNKFNSVYKSGYCLYLVFPAKQITENGKTATFTYNAAFDRVKMMVSDCGKSILTRYYLGNCYELEVADNIHKETLYLCGDYYSAPAVVVKHSLFAETGPK